MKIDKEKRRELNLYWNTQYTDEQILSIYKEIKDIDDEIKILQENKMKILNNIWISKWTFYYRLRKLGKTIRKQV